MRTWTAKQIDLGNNEGLAVGIAENSGGTFTAMTFSASRGFKTFAGARAWLSRRGYTVSEAADLLRLPVTFELNGKGYRTDTETLEVLRLIIPRAKASGDSSAVIAVMELGQLRGRIETI